MSARAREGSCSKSQVIKASESKGEKTAPGYMFVMGLSAPDICIMSMMGLCHGTCDNGLRVPYTIFAHRARLGHW